MNKMVQVDAIDFSGGTIRQNDPCVVDDRTNGGCYLLDNLVLMQYTGLTDRNGKEIYEGDFLRCKNSAQSPYDHSDSSLRVVKRDPKTHQLGLFGSVNDDYQASGFGLSETTRKRWEIVGNIHEGIR